MTPSRLHFGLLGWGDSSFAREFGGVGLMIERPGIELRATLSTQWEATGSLGERALRTARNVAETLVGPDAPRLRIKVLRAPVEHVGLGTGTQCDLAAARTAIWACGRSDISIEGLAKLTGRGRRSGIGLHGFAHGGLIVDGGRRRGEAPAPPPLVARVAFPDDWGIVLVTPPAQAAGLSGVRESTAFALLPSVPLAVTDRLCRRVLLELVPAVIEHDLDAFGTALEAIQEEVGAAFAPAQGGTYADPSVRDALRDLGLRGVGQSSWGPTLYGFAPHSDERERARITTALAHLGAESLWTRADNAGAVITEAPTT